MTEVRINLTRQTAAGRVAAVGVLRWYPSRRVHIDGPTDEVIVPAGFTVPVNGPTLIEIDPTGTNWVWRVEEATAGGRVVHAVAVPDSPTVIDYGDLVDVDPTTLAPAAEPSAAWWAAHDALAAEVGSMSADPEIIGQVVADYLAANPPDSVQAHIDSPTPHPAYDIDMQDLSGIYRSRLV